jgi:hypothetical protein
MAMYQMQHPEEFETEERYTQEEKAPAQEDPKKRKLRKE